MREDVRDAEICVALVGDVLRDSEKQGFQGCFEGGAAVSEARAGGAGGCGWGDGWRVAITGYNVVRVP